MFWAVDGTVAARVADRRVSSSTERGCLGYDRPSRLPELSAPSFNEAFRQPQSSLSSQPSDPTSSGHAALRSSYMITFQTTMMPDDSSASFDTSVSFSITWRRRRRRTRSTGQLADQLGCGFRDAL